MNQTEWISDATKVLEAVAEHQGCPGEVYGDRSCDYCHAWLELGEEHDGDCVVLNARDLLAAREVPA